MFCNYCRAVNPNDAVYCSACGQTIRASIEDGKKQHENASVATLSTASKTPSSSVKSSDDTVTQPTQRILSAEELEKLTDTELDELWSVQATSQVLPRQNLQEELRRRALRTEKAATTQATVPFGGNELGVDDAQREKSLSAPSKAAPLAADIFRDGNDLHVRRGAHFPSVCIKCGQPAETFIKKNSIGIPLGY